MGDGSLSQDEIDALLKGTDDVLPQSEPVPSAFSGPSSNALNQMQRNVLTDNLNSVMASVAPTLGGYLQKELSISNAMVDVKDQSSLANEFIGEYVQVQMGYNGGATGQNLLILSMQDAGAIASLMMGQEGAPPAELTEAHKSTLQEFISTLVSSAATQLGMKTGMTIGTSPPDISVVSSPNDLRIPPGESVKITYNINVGGVLNSQMFHIMDLPLALSLSGGASQSFSQAPAGGFAGGGQQPQQMQPAVDISPVKFPPLSGSGIPEGAQNISLLMDVQLTLTVELGRTKQLVKDVLGLGEGSIIELDKLAGEPVDLLVNNKLIAKGEVVVIDENFGVRVTDIVSPSERLTKIV